MISVSAVTFWVTPSELIIKDVFMYVMKLVQSQRNSYQNQFAAMCNDVLLQDYITHTPFYVPSELMRARFPAANSVSAIP